MSAEQCLCCVQRDELPITCGERSVSAVIFQRLTLYERDQYPSIVFFNALRNALVQVATGAAVRHYSRQVAELLLAASLCARKADFSNGGRALTQAEVKHFGVCDQHNCESPAYVCDFRKGIPRPDSETGAYPTLSQPPVPARPASQPPVPATPMPPNPVSVAKIADNKLRVHATRNGETIGELVLTPTKEIEEIFTTNRLKQYFHERSESIHDNEAIAEKAVVGRCSILAHADRVVLSGTTACNMKCYLHTQKLKKRLDRSRKKNAGSDGVAQTPAKQTSKRSHTDSEDDAPQKPKRKFTKKQKKSPEPATFEAHSQMPGQYVPRDLEESDYSDPPTPRANRANDPSDTD
jgi:hypothetical protein